jgi:peptide/nickel transport system permease protein
VALRTPRGISGIACVVVVVLLGVLAPVLAPASPDAQEYETLLGISGGHLLGTDELGRDLLSRVLYGTRLDLEIALIAVPAGAVIGSLLGFAGGVWKGAGLVLQRLSDVIIAFPAMILGVTFVAIHGPGQATVEVTILVVNLPIFARLARGALLSQRSREYVVAATVAGSKPWSIVARHILPNSSDALIVQLALSMSGAVIIEGGLSVVGLGIQPPQPSLGALIQAGLPYLSKNAAYVLGPVAVILILVVGLNLLADSLSDGMGRR